MNSLKPQAVINDGQKYGHYILMGRGNIVLMGRHVLVAGSLYRMSALNNVWPVVQTGMNEKAYNKSFVWD
jgi:hypothetical protein